MNLATPGSAGKLFLLHGREHRSEFSIRVAACGTLLHIYADTSRGRQRNQSMVLAMADVERHRAWNAVHKRIRLAVTGGRESKPGVGASEPLAEKSPQSGPAEDKLSTTTGVPEAVQAYALLGVEKFQSLRLSERIGFQINMEHEGPWGFVVGTIQWGSGHDGSIREECSDDCPYHVASPRRLKRQTRQEPRNSRLPVSPA